MNSTLLALTILKFSAKFLQEMDQTKSVVASPLSAEFTLALTALGATGDTHTELLEGLGLPDDDTVRTSFASLSSSLKSLKSLNVANKIYLKEGLGLLPAMKKDAELFDTEFGEVDFEDTAKTTSEINNWAENKTNSKIKDIYSSDGNEDKIALVLLNAIYFKGGWLHRFNPNHTQSKPFRVDSTKVITVPMMYYHDKEHFSHKWSKALNAQILMLPYEESNSKMAIILPREFNGLEDVFKKLAEGHDLLSDIRNNMWEHKIRIALPKFKIETTIDLKDILKKLGMTAMFKGGFTKILNDSRPLKVSKVIQKAFIEVNEEGTEVAAASQSYSGELTKEGLTPYMHYDMMISIGEKFTKTSMPPFFHANHPFAIVFGPGDIPIFVGAYRGDDTAPLSSIQEFNNKW